MNPSIRKLRKIEYWLTGGALALVIFGVIYVHILTHKQIPYFVVPFESRVNLYDETFTSALSNITDFVPSKTPLTVSSSSGVIKYFTGHPVKVPWNVSSQQSLLKFMAENNSTYLVVPEIRGNGSSIEALKPLFSDEGLVKLEHDFEKIAEFKTQFSKIYLYKRLA